jgi:hypothetical protein
MFDVRIKSRVDRNLGDKILLRCDKKCIFVLWLSSAILVSTAPRQISGQRLGYLDNNACRTGNQQVLRQPPGAARD